MKRVLKAIGIVVGVLLALVAGAIAFVFARYPIVQPPSAEKIVPTPELVARGKYVAENVAACGYCHSTKYEDRWGRPTKAGGDLAGGLVLERSQGYPFRLPMPNLTPHETGLAAWSDGEIIRAIREGVGRDGRPLFAMMPFQVYRAMGDDDVRAVVAYLRSLKPVASKVERPDFDMPLPIVNRLLPKPVDGPVAPPPKADRVKYGEYLANAASCTRCHTPFNERHEHDQTRLGAGGFRMAGPWGAVTSPNITSHPDGFLGRATREQFVAKFKAYRGKTADDMKPSAPGSFSVMPWLEFSEMTEDDLGAIYDFLRTLPPLPGVHQPFAEIGKAG